MRNELAEDATGDWLCFLDADDELAPGYLDAMKRAYERESRAPTAPLLPSPPLESEDWVRRGGAWQDRAGRGVAPLFTPAVQRIEKGRKRPPFFYPEVPLDQANWLVIGTLIERDLFMRIGGFEDYPHGFEDWSLWAKAHKMGAWVVKVPQAIYIQHVNPQSKHRVGWRNRRWQVETHQKVARELEAWTPS